MQPAASTAPNSGLPAALTTGGLRRRRAEDDFSAFAVGLAKFLAEEARERGADEDPTRPGPDGIGHPETPEPALETVETMTANRSPDDEPGPWDAADMSPEDWDDIINGFLEFVAEEKQEPEHADDPTRYFRRALTNGDALSTWAQKLGLKDVVPGDKMNLSVGFCRDASAVPAQDALAVPDSDGEWNGTRSLERLRMNGTGPVVLRFASPDLVARRQELDDSTKYRPGERPYVVVAADPGEVDLSEAVPYAGPLQFGPEEQAEAENKFGSTGSVVFVSRKGKVLFLKRATGVPDAGEWDLPGGHVEAGEDAQTAARRESLEETGVPPPTALRLVDRVSFGGENHVTFAADVGKRFKPALSEEHVDWEWADPRKPPQPLRPVVAAALAAMQKAAAEPGPVAEEHFGAAVMYVEPDGRILFLKRGKGEHEGRWDLPGGRAEPDEKPEATAAREASEESGREPGKLKLVDKGPPLAGAKDKGYFATFASKAPRFVPQISDEHADHVWAHPSRPPRPLHPGVAAVLTRIADHQAQDEEEPQGAAVDPDAQAGRVQPTGPGSPDQDADPTALDEAPPKALYVMRPLRGAKELVAWAKRAGFRNPLPASEMHATVAYSRSPLKWPPASTDKSVKVKGGFRSIEKLGDKGAVVLRFDSRELSDRWREFLTAGATWDWDGYRPHVTITYDPGQVDLEKVEPFDGTLEFGPEEFAEVDDRWADEPLEIALDTALRLAFDYAEKPSKEYDADGRLHFEDVCICKENISPYIGREIPNWEELGLDPNRIYKLYRPGEELEKAHASSNGIPVLRRHKAVSAKDHDYWETVGSIGTRARWDAPFIKNDFSVWPAADIEGVESGAKKEISPGYRYKPVMEPGNFDGEDYDGRMTDIAFNHVAIVETGRQGPEVTLDSADELLWQLLGDAISEACDG